MATIDDKNAPATDTMIVQVHKVKELTFNIVEPTKRIREKITQETLTPVFRFAFHWELEQDIFVVIFGIDYRFKEKKDDEKETNLLSLSIGVEYQIDDLKKHLEILNNEDGKSRDFRMNEKIMALLTGTAYSTARGIIHCKTAGYFLNRFPLPLMPIDQIKKMQSTKVKA